MPLPDISQDEQNERCVELLDGSPGSRGRWQVSTGKRPRQGETSIIGDSGSGPIIAKVHKTLSFAQTKREPRFPDPPAHFLSDTPPFSPLSLLSSLPPLFHPSAGDGKPFGKLKPILL